jgi:Down syndrome cell adhesion protein
MVPGPPVIEPFGFPIQDQDSGRTQVTCSISSGDLPIKVSWTKDGRSIANNLNVG